jgi:hypothetical protein
LLVVVLFATVPQRQREVLEHDHRGKVSWVEAYCRGGGNVIETDWSTSFAVYPGNAKDKILFQLQWLHDRKLSFFRDHPAAPAPTTASAAK